MKKWHQVAAGMIISGVCLWYTFRGFDVAALGERAANFSWGWLAPAAGLFCLSFSLRAVRWCWILSSMQPVRYLTVLPVLIFGFFMNSILPARAGELARAVAISKKSQIPASSALGSIVAERTMDLFGLLTVMLIAARLVPRDKLPLVPIVLSAVGLLVAMVAGTLLLPRLPAGRSPLAQKVLSFVSRMGAGFSVIRKPSRVTVAILLSITIWLLDVVTVCTISGTTGIDLSLTQAAGLVVGTSVGVMIPAAPGYVGTYEFFGKEMLMMLGFAPEAALTFVLLLHFFQFVMIVCLGVPSMLWIGVHRDNEKVP